MKIRSLILILLLAGACVILGVGIGTWIVFNANTDTTAPNVTIINPTDGATVSNSINISFTAVDANLIDSYRIYVDGVLLTTSNKTLWNTLNEPDGSHTILCRATDEMNNTGEASITVTVDNLANFVVINEFLPNPNTGPDTTHEYIELYNPRGDDVNISGYVLDDSDLNDLNNYTISVSTVIPAGGFLTFNRSETGISLNNDGDTVNFIAPDGTIVDFRIYEETDPEVSIGREIDGGETWTTFTTPTYGTSNNS